MERSNLYPTKVNVYLSSTTFVKGEDPDVDCNWKSVISKHGYSFFKIAPDTETLYGFEFHDPLQKLSDKPEIVVDDIQHIITSDFVVCYLPATKLTLGTMMELQYACINKPKDCVILIDRYKIHRNHPWIKFWVKHIVDNEDDAATLMMNIIRNPKFSNLKEG